MKSKRVIVALTKREAKAAFLCLSNSTGRATLARRASKNPLAQGTAAAKIGRALWVTFGQVKF